MRILLFSLSFLLALPAIADVYRTVDEDGTVTFSDKPTEGAEKISKKKLQTIKSPDNLPQFRPTSPREDKSKQPSLYNDIAITYPENDSSIRHNSGDFTVRVSLKPGLRSSGHEVSLKLDGQEIASGRSSSFNLNNVNRGTHTLVAAVKGQDGNVIIQSDPVTFTLLRHSVQHPPPGSNIPKPAPAPSP